MLAKPPSSAPTPEDSIGVVDISYEPKRRVEVDTERLPLSRMLIHAEGYKWTLKAYYRRMAGMDNTLDNLDLAINDPSQQYIKVKGQVVRVSSPLSPVQNTEDKWFNMQGEGYFDDGTIPNTGDVFVATIGDGVDVIFLVTNTERMVPRKNSSYRTEYQAMLVLTDEYEASLDAKVTDTYIYSPEHLERTGEVLVTEENFYQLIDMNKQVEALKVFYFREFLDNRFRSLSVPSQGLPTHDAQVVAYAKFLGITDLEEYNHPPFEAWKLDSLYAFLRKPNESYLPFLAKEFGTITTTAFYGSRSYGNIAFSGYKYTVWSGDYKLGQASKNYGAVAKLVVPDNEVYEPVMGPDNIPYFNPLSLSPYVLSEGFYSGTGETVLEVALLRFIRREHVDIKTAQELYKYALELPPIEMFYYIPLVITVMLYVGM
jgi:hypothetical protein